MPTDDAVLVTGGTEFIGPNVVDALARDGRRVYVLSETDFSEEGRALIGPALNAIPTRIGAVSDWPRLLEVMTELHPTSVLHLAANLEPESPSVAIRDNFVGTTNVLEASRLLGLRRVVFFSSIGVLPRYQTEPIEPDHPLLLRDEGSFTGSYGASKAAAEHFCFAYLQQFGLDFRTIRVSAAYGFGFSAYNFLRDIVEPAVRGEAIRLGRGSKVPRSFTHASDLAALALAVLDAPDDADRIFFGANGAPLGTVEEAAAIVSDLVPNTHIEKLADFAEEDAGEREWRGVLSIENARTQLDWAPRYASMRDGLAEYVDRYTAFAPSGDS